ncbi:MAG: glycerophosphoryl diester phosphodiesterase [Deltaproteobacteria bacterium]|nr:MAG: glycerophosphoryl diester phosphodiesterase [Deltaproteobacteria bacterium]
MSGLFLYAHRGASAEAPENTLAAFARALEAGADGVELDVHLSADGVPVVIHDETLERTTDGEGPVDAWEREYLQALDAGSWFAPHFAGEGVPTLDQVLHLLAGRLRLNLEVKDVRAGQAVLEALRGYPAADVMLSSFDCGLLFALRRAAPEMPLAVLHDAGNWRRALGYAEALRAAAFHPRADLIGRPLLTACRSLRLPVYAWTVDDPGEARALARMGVAGVFANDPAGLRGRLFPRPVATVR